MGPILLRLICLRSARFFRKQGGKVKKSRLNSPPIKEKVIEYLAVCHSQASIGRWVGLHQSQISRFANRKDIKDLVERKQLELIATNLPTAGERLTTLLDAEPKDYRGMKLQLRASAMVFQMAHELSSPRQSNCISCRRLWRSLRRL